MAGSVSKRPKGVLLRNFIYASPRVMDQHGEDPTDNPIMKLFKRPRIIMAALGMAAGAAISEDPSIAMNIVFPVAMITCSELMFRSAEGRAKTAGHYYVDTQPGQDITPPSQDIIDELHARSRYEKETSGLTMAFAGVLTAFDPGAFGTAVFGYFAARNYESQNKLDMVLAGEWEAKGYTPSYTFERDAPPATDEPQRIRIPVEDRQNPYRFDISL